jgi:hypothetical protein
LVTRSCLPVIPLSAEGSRSCQVEVRTVCHSLPPTHISLLEHTYSGQPGHSPPATTPRGHAPNGQPTDRTASTPIFHSSTVIETVQLNTTLNDPNTCSFIRQGQMNPHGQRCYLLVGKGSAWEWVAPFLGFSVLGVWNRRHSIPDKVWEETESNTTIFCSGTWATVRRFWDGLSQRSVCLGLHRREKPRRVPG